ncbi:MULTISPECIES: maleylpyruvate isomerase N-terminal domain-containing protein [Catenuloplanes]|uniref:Uncharacterized protein (TIGR03083 family) n=1 Tax=Catenuloplanes niger TaxID=587534 RepID=A0AAE3ZXP7_9ACTN|nr:maleylpyruvate isomerase N-terminal domain-containing protein [Catenuloplanes niger]MDR7325740.1 uncharacterized protein (TIGR03083 family) [Catenuloplanes niger]
MTIRNIYLAAAETFADLASRTPVDGLDGPGVGEWSLRELVGHTVSAALRPVAVAGESPQPGLVLDSAEAYCVVIQGAPRELLAASAASVTQNARDYGKALGDRPGAVVREHLARAGAALDGVGDDELVVSPVGAMKLRDWLSTRVLELVVHTSDIALAAGVPVTHDAAAVTEAAVFAARATAALGAGVPLVRALTGREPLPSGFSVVQ